MRMTASGIMHQICCAQQPVVGCSALCPSTALVQSSVVFSPSSLRKFLMEEWVTEILKQEVETKIVRHA